MNEQISDRLDVLWERAVDETPRDQSKSAHEIFAAFVILECADFLYYRGQVYTATELEEHFGVRE